MHVVVTGSRGTMTTCNTVEAAVRAGVPRFVYCSSETVPGFFFPQRDFRPAYAPVDEEHPVTPQDPYALSKWFGEQLLDAAVARSDIRCLSFRLSWVMHPGNYERNLGPQVRDAGVLSPSLWSYVDVEDVADAIVLGVTSDLPGHEVMYLAQPDNAGGHDFAAVLREHYATRSGCASSTARTPPGSAHARRSGCSAGTPAGRGATTSTATGGHYAAAVTRAGDHPPRRCVGVRRPGCDAVPVVRSGQRQPSGRRPGGPMRSAQEGARTRPRGPRSWTPSP